MKHKSEDYKLTAVEYYLVEDKSQEEVCKIFKCSPRILMKWVEKYNNDGEIEKYNKKPVASSNHQLNENKTRASYYPTNIGGRKTKR